MCGLVGIAGKLAFKDEATMKRLFLLDFFRGPDSTGLAAIRSNGDAKLAKLASHPLDLFEMQRFKDALNGTQSRVFIGHNRAATRGIVSNYNAHPYQFEHIVGAHNGTLDTGSTKELEEALGEKFGVDSMAIFAAIAKFGIDETVKLMREGPDSQTGAWSLVWFDQLEGSLNFLRNKHRPMWTAFSKEFDRLFWASEWPMIDAATRMSAQGYDLYAEGEQQFRFFQTEADIHYKFDVALLCQGGTERPKPKIKELKGKVPLPVAAASGYTPFQRPTQGTNSSGCGTGSRSQTTTSRSKKQKEEVQIIHLLGDVGNPFAGYMDEEKFKALAKYGCSWCGCDVDYGEQGITIFERDDVLLCPECSLHNRDKGGPTTRIHVTGAAIDNLM